VVGQSPAACPPLTPAIDAGPPSADGHGAGQEPQPVTQPSIDMPMPEQGDRFRRPRTNFTQFASSGGRDTRALQRAVGGYVRSGTRGSRNAVKLMGSARGAAGNVLGIFREVERDGVETALRHLNLQRLIGGTPQDMFIGLTDVICHDGGSIDEATARAAWLETAAEIDKIGVLDLSALTAGQIREIFLTFVAHAIETHLYQQIGINGFAAAQSLADIERTDAQFRSYIERAVRDSFTSDFADLSTMSDGEIGAVVDRTFQEAWELLMQVERITQ
jgi:hypothetical protein